MKTITGLLLAVVTSFVNLKSTTESYEPQIAPRSKVESTTTKNDVEYQIPSRSQIKPNIVVAVPMDNKNGPMKRRYRRMLGQRSKCVPVMKLFCKIFKHLDVSEKFCLKVPVVTCWGLD